MNFTRTPIEGCYLIDPEPRGDHRGFFARFFDADAFRAQGIADSYVQFNNSLSTEAATLRGLHYQRSPSGEEKLVRCIAGSVYDVVLDLRRGSPTHGQWTAAELSAENRRLIHVPKGCAHGFLTLEPNTELIYFASAPYAAADEQVVRWNDPALSIAWPQEPAVMSDKDRFAPDYDPSHNDSGY